MLKRARLRRRQRRADTPGDPRTPGCPRPAPANQLIIDQPARIALHMEPAVHIVQAPKPTPAEHRQQVRCIEAEGFEHPDLAAGAPYDLIFANILKGPLIALAPAMRAHMADGGYAILSGILNEQADDVIAAYAAEGFRLVARDRLGEWTTITISP